jgi:hypothetical protein
MYPKIKKINISGLILEEGKWSASGAPRFTARE